MRQTRVILLCVSVVAVATSALAQAVNPYAFNFTIQSGSKVDFTANQYSGNTTDPSHFIASWSNSTGVTGTMQAAIWQTSAGANSYIQMNSVNVYGSSAIGPSDWFYMTTSLGDTRVSAKVQNLHMTDNGVSGSAPVVNGNFLIPDFQSKVYGTLTVDLEYHVYVPFFGYSWVAVPFVSPITEDLAAHNDPPPKNDLGGAVSGSGTSTILSTTQSMQTAVYMNPYAAKYDITCDYTLATTFNPSITANVTGTPVLQLSADAGANTTVYGQYGNGTLNASGSYDPQGNTITSYAWDLDGNGEYNDKVGQAATVTKADLAALGLSYGQHTVGLRITADDGYWATDQLTLTYLPSILGDTDSNGKVDITDLGNLLANYGKTSGGTWTLGDTDLNGKVDITDLGNLLANYGKTVSPASSEFTAVPEPSSIAMLLSLGLGLAGFGLRKQDR